MGRKRTLLVAFVASIPACSDAPQEGAHGEASQAVTVADAAGSSCTTLSVKGLSEQIVAAGNCISPGAFVEVPALPNVTFSATVFPYLEQPARDAFIACAGAHPTTSMGVNSMLRTVAQQYLLYHWYLNGQCGIGLAAEPGASNHETGLAFDTDDAAAWTSALSAYGFQWLGSADPVHFDYVGPGAVDHGGTDVLAFQKLWNANNPEDPIGEDGLYGPETEARLTQSPAEGFATAPGCGTSTSSSGGAAGGGGQGGHGTTPTSGGAGGRASDGEGGGGGDGVSEGEGCACGVAPGAAARGSGAILFSMALLFARRRRRSSRTRASRLDAHFVFDGETGPGSEPSCRSSARRVSAARRSSDFKSRGSFTLDRCSAQSPTTIESTHA